MKYKTVFTIPMTHTHPSATSTDEEVPHIEALSSFSFPVRSAPKLSATQHPQPHPHPARVFQLLGRQEGEYVCVC